MYRRIMASSNVFVINRIAELLREYLLRNAISPASELSENTGITQQKKKKKEKPASVEDYISQAVAQKTVCKKSERT